MSWRSAGSIAAPMLQRDLLNRRPYFHVFFHRPLLFQGSIEAGPADLAHLAHSLDTQAALHWHQLPDSVVDAFAPEPLLLRRRASTFCKAPLKKSTSSTGRNCNRRSAGGSHWYWLVCDGRSACAVAEGAHELEVLCPCFGVAFSNPTDFAIVAAGGTIRRLSSEIRNISVDGYRHTFIILP